MRFQSAEEWQIVFFIASGIFVVGSIVYGIFASGEVQPWAIQCENDKSSEADTITQDSF